MSKRRWTMAEIQKAYENSKPAEFLSLGNLMKALAALPEPPREPSEGAAKTPDYIVGVSGHAYESLKARISALEAERDSLAEQVRVLREGLEFYADSYRYGRGNGMSWESCHELERDAGERARETLKAADEIAGKR